MDFKNQELLEQYKLYVEMADRISDRRMKANQFYTTILSGLLALTAFAVHKDNQQVIGDYKAFIFLAVGLLGIVFCLVWQINIHSYRQLNSKKFQVIHQMEAMLSFAPYDKEWELLGNGKDAKKYFQLTRVEKIIPMIITVPYLLIIIFSVHRLVS